jgi:hypothetical protein
MKDILCEVFYVIMGLLLVKVVFGLRWPWER